MNDVAASVVKQTDTQTKYRNPAAHAPRVNDKMLKKSFIHAYAYS